MELKIESRKYISSYARIYDLINIKYGHKKKKKLYLLSWNEILENNNDELFIWYYEYKNKKI